VNLKNKIHRKGAKDAKKNFQLLKPIFINLGFLSFCVFDARHPWRAPYGRTNVRPIPLQAELCGE
jgi:hypothetical protein